MEWLTGISIIGLAVFTIREVRRKVSKSDCRGQPCPDVKVLFEIIEGRPGKAGMAEQVRNIERAVIAIREHQVNGGGR